METFLTSYGIPFEPFQTLLQTTNSLIAGSAPLALYLQEKGVDPGFVPGDIDIWAEDSEDEVGNQALFTDFFLSCGYSMVHAFYPEEYDELRFVTAVISLVNPVGKKIHVILLKVCDVHYYMFEHFDLSPCMTWWNAFSNQFETMWPEETLNKEMHCYRSRLVGTREAERIEKYISRGFRLVEWPCASLGLRDLRENVAFFADQTAFDLFAYDDVSIVDFLKASSFHVLLRVGEQFYAFHRDILHEYFEQHRSIHPMIGELADTPHKQTIVSEAATLLRFSDYSIAELIFDSDVFLEDQTKSVHSVRFYTTTGWATGQVGNVIRPLPMDLWS